ncbi:MAG: hypothetical protein KAJ40_02060 [Alphaproteobacteria bacterium]|nr:hypothetical protein [Alphaproteobacteria bacterium]
MLPDEIYAGSASTSSSNFKYTQPLNNMPVNDGSMRTHLTHDLMTFMGKDDYDPQNSDDEIDIMIVDGFYKEAEILARQRLKANPDDEKTQFQKAFIDYLKGEYKRTIEHEDIILAVDPRNVNALINKSFALANLNREEEALKLIDKALYYDPENITALGNKAYIAKLLWRDQMREDVLKQTYNASAKLRHEQLVQDESKFLRDMKSAFMHIDTPSAFKEFNRRSGYDKSCMIH